MIQKNITITNPSGLNVMPARILSRHARQYECDILIYHRHYQINAKSLMHILSAALISGTEILLECDGPDEEACMQDLCELFANGLEKEVPPT